MFAASLVLAGCGSSLATSAPPTADIPATPIATSPNDSPPPSQAPLQSPAATGFFAFAAEDIAAYYVTQGFTCLPPTPSTKAAGFLYTGCQKVDTTGRTLVVGLVTQPNGALASGFASVSVAPDETVVEPADALDHLSRFLGATMGGEPGATAALWMTEHLGLAYEQTTFGPIAIATYTQGTDDASRIFVEVADPAYLEAPAPSG